MSAFVVGKDHIDFLVTSIVECPRRHPHGPLLSIYVPDEAAPYGYRVEYANDRTGLGRLLLAENVASVTARYPDMPASERRLYRDMINSYSYERVRELDRFPHPVAAVVKAWECYEYQSCEHDGWRESIARRWMEAAIRRWIDTLPGMDDAPTWEFTREGGRNYLDRLTALTA